MIYHWKVIAEAPIPCSDCIWLYIMADISGNGHQSQRCSQWYIFENKKNLIKIKDYFICQYTCLDIINTYTLTCFIQKQILRSNKKYFFYWPQPTGTSPAVAPRSLRRRDCGLCWASAGERGIPADAPWHSSPQQSLAGTQPRCCRHPQSAAAAPAASTAPCLQRERPLTEPFKL